MSKETEKNARKRRRWPWIVLGVLVVLVVAFVWLIPTIIVSISYPKLTIDLLPILGDSITNLVTRTTATVDLKVSRDDIGGFVVKANGHILDWPYTVRAGITPKLRFLGIDAEGDVTVSLDNTPWQLTADFKASSSGEWKAKLWMDKTDFTENDPVIGQILSRLNLVAVSNIAFNGSIALSAKAERTAEVPVPQWNATCRLSNMNASCDFNNKPIMIENLRLKVGALGIAGHRDILPIYPKADCVTMAGFTLSNVFANVYTTEQTVTNVVSRTFLVSEAGARCCEGDVKIYSLLLNDDQLNVTLFVDGIDTGAALKHMHGFYGEASGRLYGKLPLNYHKDTHSFHLNNIYLYSVPGETGQLRMYDSKPILDNLAMGGVTQATCDNLSKALADLSYDVFKISLQPEPDGGMALTLKIAGKSTHGDTTVPVSLEVTFHGDLEQLLNTSFRTLKRNKGKSK